MINGDNLGSPSAAEDRDVFEVMRPRLLGLAYRILGSHAEAEDAVQDTFLRWQTTNQDVIATPGAWLTTVCTRRAVDLLRSAYRTRVDYVGNWLPEPIHTITQNEAETKMDLASSLSTAFLLMLERLSPKERAAYLLYEIFDMPYADVAASLDMTEPACRKLVSRAKVHVGDNQRRFQPAKDKQEQLLAAFEAAVRTGQPGSLARMLASDVRLTADGGGKVPTVSGTLHGDGVLAFLTQKLGPWWADFEWTVVEINGAVGHVLKQAGKPVAALTFAYNDRGEVGDIFIMRNPDKLERLSQVNLH